MKDVFTWKGVFVFERDQLMGQCHEKSTVWCLIAWGVAIGLNYGPRTVLYFCKTSVKELWFFKMTPSLNKSVYILYSVQYWLAGILAPTCMRVGVLLELTIYNANNHFNDVKSKDGERKILDMWITEDLGVYKHIVQ